MLKILQKRKIKKMQEKEAMIKYLIRIGMPLDKIASKMKISRLEAEHYMYL